MVFYAILYGATLGSMGSFIPFPWGDIDKKWNLLRVLLSLLILNVLPFLYFLGMFFLLESRPFYLHDWSQRLFAFLVLLSALGIFAFYRLYHIIFWWDNQKHNTLRHIPILKHITLNWFWPNFPTKQCEHRKDKSKVCEKNEHCWKPINDCWEYITRKRNTEWGRVRGHWIAFFFYLTPFFIIAITSRYNYIFWTSFILYLIFLFIFVIEYLKCGGNKNEAF